VAIAYKSAGAGGGTETSAASLDLACPASVDANDILVAHVTHEGLSTAPTTPSGWSFLYGPALLGDATAVGRAWVYGKLADGSEDGATIGFGTAGGTAGRYGRIYSFSGWVSGAIEDLFSGWIDDPSEGSIPLPPVQTQSAGALAVALLVQDDNNSFAAAGAVTGGTWAEPVAEFVSTTLGAQGCCVGIQTSTPTGDPGHISGGTANATADEGSSIGFSLHDTAQTVISFSSQYDITDTPRTFNIPGCDVGDRLLVIVGGNKTSGANAPTDCTTSTTVGTTSSWTEVVEILNASGTSCWLSSASATVSSAGDITVSVSRSQPATVQAWGFTVWRLRGYGAIGVSASQGDAATEVLSLTVADGSFVAFGGFDWDVALPTGYDPSTGARQTFRSLIGSVYSATTAWWSGQAAGTRNYGTTGSATASYTTVAIEVLAGSTTLVVQDAAQAQSTDAIALTQVHVLVVQDAAQAQAVDSPTLTQAHVLVVDDAAQAQAADEPTLTQAHVLAVQDAAQAQAADEPTLTQAHSLVVQDAAQAQAADNVTLTVDGGVVAFRALSTATGTDDSAEGTIPTGTTTEDFMVAFLTSASSTATVSTPASGWDLQEADPSPADFSTWCYSRRWQSGDSNPTWTLSVAGGWTVDIVSYSGTDSTTPVNVDIGEQGAALQEIALGPVTPTVDDCMLVAFGAVDAAGGARTWTEDGAMTERLDQMDNALHRVVAEELLSGGSGAGQTRTLTFSGSTQDVAGFLLALAPGAGGSTTLVVADAAQAQTTDTIALTQVHTLAVQDAAQAQTTDAIVLDVATTLVVQDAAQDQFTFSDFYTDPADDEYGNIGLIQVHNLTVADATQAQATDAIALTQVHTLVVADAAQAQSTDAIALTQVHTLVVADATQAQSADNVVLAIDGALVVQDATQAQTADNVVLTQVHNLVVQDAAQAQPVDNVALTQVHSLVVADAAQAQTADAVTLTQVHVLTVQDALQAQTTDAIALTQVHNLTVADAGQLQSTDSVTLTQTHVLTVADGAHAHSVDSLTLTQVHVITVQDALQAHTADNVVLIDLSLGMLGEVYSRQPRAMTGGVSSGTTMIGAIT
jgi:dihydrofolate reductase